MVFEKMAEQDEFTLENQDGLRMDIGDRDIGEFLEEMFTDSNQFATLTAPKAQPDVPVRFVQATLLEDGIDVQLGVEQEDGVHLVEKLCLREECIQIFLDFFHGEFLPDLKEYKPVEFL